MGHFGCIFYFLRPPCTKLATPDVHKNESSYREFSEIQRAESQTLLKAINVFLSALSAFIDHFG